VVERREGKVVAKFLEVVGELARIRRLSLRSFWYVSRSKSTASHAST
jgi:hypothetical protein